MLVIQMLPRQNKLILISGGKGNDVCNSHPADDSPIVPLTEAHLLSMVGNEPQILKLIEKRKLVKAV